MEFLEDRDFRIDRHGYFCFGRKRIHRMIWEHYHGKIPKGYHIHHIDHDKLNNSIHNLACISHSDHLSLHMKLQSEELHKWHKSDAGRKSMSEKAKKEFLNRPEKTFICKACNKEFKTKHHSEVKYCGDNCVMRARRERKEDMETRCCVICSNSFSINKYQKTKTCSFICRNKLISKLKLK